MSFKKKIIYTIILVLIIVLGYHYFSIAGSQKYTYNSSNNTVYLPIKKKSYSIGATIPNAFKSGDRDNSWNLLCVQKNHHMGSTRVDYTLLDVIRIEGLTAKSVKSNKSVEGRLSNGRMAYMIYHGLGHGSSSYNYDILQHAIWYYMKYWYEDCLSYFSGNPYNGFTDSGVPTKGEAKSLIDKAESYSKDSKSFYAYFQYMFDCKNSGGDYEKNFEYGGKNYLRIKTFNFKTNAKMSDVSRFEIYDQDGNKINDVRFYDVKTQEVRINYRELNSNFWILLPYNEKNITKVTIKTTVNHSTYTADVILFKTREDKNYQNLIAVDADEKTVSENYNVDVNTKLNISIVKKDSSTGATIKGAGFKFKRTADNRWIKSSNNTITFVTNESEATEFFTDDNGRILIENVMYGNYQAKETTVPAYYLRQSEFSSNIPTCSKGAFSYTKPSSGYTTTYFYIKRLSDNKFIQLADDGAHVLYTGEPSNATKFSKKASIPYLSSGTYRIYDCDKSTEDGKTTYAPGDKITDIEITTALANQSLNIYNTPAGKLKITKVDYNNNNTKLKGATFDVYNSSDTKVTTLTTDSNGEATSGYLPVGTYKIIETKAPQNYIILDIEKEKTATITAKKTTNVTVKNASKFIKLSGHVWLDSLNGKGNSGPNSRNNLYQSPDSTSDPDKNLAGITVKLMQKTNATPLEKAKTTTDANGNYKFENVDSTQLSTLYVEFEYNGLKYQNVSPELTNVKGSKAVEPAGNTRDNLNKNFSTIQKDSTSTGISLKDKYNVSTQQNSKQISYLDYENIKDYNCSITATTLAAGYNLNSLYTIGNSEITNINLGLYERTRPELYALNDISSATVSINNESQEYTQLGSHDGEYKIQLFEDDLKDMQSKYEQSQNPSEIATEKLISSYNSVNYTQGIYSSDYTWDDPTKVTPSDISDKELKLAVTYKIVLGSNTTPKRIVNGRTIVPQISSKINSIAYYFDNKYDIKSVVDEKGNELNYDKNLTPIDSNFNKTLINTSSLGNLNPQSSASIYITLELSRDDIENIIEKENISLNQNIVEIASYTSYDESNNLYGTIDKKSNPDNLSTITDSTKYELDTDNAPALTLESKGVRTITGNVFLDNSTVNENNERFGDGIFDPAKESTIANVDVQLISTDESGQTFDIVKTQNDGSYTLSGFIPGTYEIKYVWGTDKGGYDVRYYKGTIYNDLTRKDNNYWYLDETHRYSDALDNWETRLKIDKYTQTKEGDETTTMDSYTPTIKFEVERDSINPNKIFNIQHVDFGIVERPKQTLELTKNVKDIKLNIQNGPYLINTDVSNKEPHFTGEASNLTYMPPDNINKYGLIKAEISSTVTRQGARIQIIYNISIKNNSEIDYSNINYYLYGPNSEQVALKTEEQLTLKADEILDYLDSKLTSIDENWETYSKNDFITDYSQQEYEKIKDTTILKTNFESLERGNTTEISLTTSKLLSSTEDELEFNNTAEIKTYQIQSYLNGETTTNYGPPLSIPPEAHSETITITGITGKNKNYTIPIIIGISTLIILGTGIILIKKKVIR